MAFVAPGRPVGRQICRLPVSRVMASLRRRRRQRLGPSEMICCRNYTAHIGPPGERRGRDFVSGTPHGIGWTVIRRCRAQVSCRGGLEPALFGFGSGSCQVCRPKRVPVLLGFLQKRGFYFGPFGSGSVIFPFLVLSVPFHTKLVTWGRRCSSQSFRWLGTETRTTM